MMTIPWLWAIQEVFPFLKADDCSLGHVLIYDLRQKQLLHTIDTESYDAIQCLSFQPPKVSVEPANFLTITSGQLLLPLKIRLYMIPAKESSLQ